MEKPTKLYIIGAFGVIAYIFIAIFALVSSPLTDGTCADYSVWQGIADAWHKGLIPAKDMFDNKGPMLHLIYYLSLIISPGKVGVYLIEGASLWVTLTMLYKIGVELGASNKRILAGIACVLFVFTYTISEGGTNEEFCLTLSLIPLWFGFRYLNGKKISYLSGIVTGICFTIIFFIRLNNLVIIASVAVTIVFVMVSRKEYALLARISIWFLTGVLLTAIPICAYFIYHGAMGDIIYNSIFYNLDYKDKWGGSNYIPNIIRLSSCFILILSVAFSNNSARSKYMLLATMLSILTFLTFINGVGYCHYFTFVLPIIFLCVIFLKFQKPLVNTLAIAAIIIPYSPVIIKQFETNLKYKFPSIYNLLPECIKIPYSYIDLNIPTEVRNKYILDQVDSDLSSIYLYGDISLTDLLVYTPYAPVGKYTSQQSQISNVNEKAKKDIILNFKKANPEIIISTVEIDIPLVFESNSYTLDNTIQYNPTSTILLIYTYIKNRESMSNMIITTYNRYREFILYGIIGGLSATLDFAIFTILAGIGIPIIVSNIIGVVSGITTSFLLNRHYNFKIKDHATKRFMIFFAVGLTGLIISTSLLYVLIKLSVSQTYAKLLTIVIVSIIQFILNKFITFKSE